LYGYQKKGVARGAIRKNIETKALAKPGQAASGCVGCSVFKEQKGSGQAAAGHLL
jgi:hypothetical protein